VLASRTAGPGRPDNELMPGDDVVFVDDDVRGQSAGNRESGIGNRESEPSTSTSSSK